MTRSAASADWKLGLESLLKRDRTRAGTSGEPYTSLWAFEISKAELSGHVQIARERNAVSFNGTTTTMVAKAAEAADVLDLLAVVPLAQLLAVSSSWHSVPQRFRADATECFKCGQSGHWSNACPDQGGGGGGGRAKKSGGRTKVSRDTGGGGGNGSGGMSTFYHFDIVGNFAYNDRMLQMRTEWTLGKRLS